MPIKVGIVGARGASSLMGFRSMPGVEVAAICDIDENILNELAEKNNIPHKFRVYEDMLDSDIDAVWVSTPMQLHVPQSIQALMAGKHVMSEVTAGVTMDELWWLIETVEKTGKVYMLAENYCYTPQVQMISNMVQQGLFGEVYFGEGEYIHEVKGMLKKDSYYWRNYWQLGKRGVFYPTHSLGPVMKWFGNERIKSVSCFGSGWHTAPDIRQEDTSLAICQTESGKLIKIRVDCISERPHNMTGYSLQGTKGCYESSRSWQSPDLVWFEGMLEPEEDRHFKSLMDFPQFLPERYKNATEEQKNTGHWGGDFFIVQDFIETIKSGGKPPIDVYEACEWTAVGLLSELSVTNNGRTMDMPDFRKSKKFNEQIINLR